MIEVLLHICFAEWLGFRCQVKYKKKKKKLKNWKMDDNIYVSSNVLPPKYVDED